MRSILVHRARLTDILWTGMQHRVTVVVAPAGYGKTTLLGDWLSTLSVRNWPVAWVSLDGYDNDPLRFWKYIVAALRMIKPSLHFKDPAILFGNCDPNNCTLLDPLINEIGDIQQHFTLVLDDYHAINNEPIHDSLAYFIEYLPENCHLILASRVLPPVHLSRLRARGQLVEVSVHDLLFTVDEAKAFFSQVMKLDLPWEQLETFLAMTEGWIAGLQLAALSLQGRRNTLGSALDLRGTPSNILDYLTEEVLVYQNDDIKDFLINTSVLEELSASLCDAILGTNNSREILATLEQKNLFIVPLDNQRLWYRYHALFAELLRVQLRRSRPGQAHRLHLAAYHWLIENGYPEKAVSHALAAGENNLAAETIERCALQAIIRMDLTTVLQWFNLLPQVEIAKRLRLVVYYALTYLMIGNMEKYETQLKTVEQNLDDLSDGEMSIEEIARLRRYVRALRAAAACMRGDFSLGLSSSQQVLDILLPEDFFFYGMVEHYMAYAYMSAGRLAEGAAALERACQNALRNNIHQEFVLSMCERARFFRLQGRLNDAARASRLALEYTKDHEVGGDIRICPMAGLADIMREWNLTQEADDLLSEPIRFLTYSSEKNTDWFFLIDVWLIVAKNRIIHGAYEEADKYIQKARICADTFQFSPEHYSEITALQVRLWLANDDLKSAENWLKRKQHRTEEHTQWTEAMNVEQIAAARVLLAIDQPKQAEQILEMALANIDDGKQADYVLTAYIFKALALWHQSRCEDASVTLLHALALAEQENRLRSFIDEGESMKAMLSYLFDDPKASKLLRAKKVGSFSKQLLRHFNGLADNGNKESGKNHRGMEDLDFSTVENLSDREEQVLNLLSLGYSSSDISQHLIISVNTSKAHIKNIYRKLDVHSRREAIEKAMELNLLVGR